MNDDKIGKHDDPCENIVAQSEEYNPFVSSIKEKREFYTNEIKHVKDIFDGYKNMVNNLSLKGRKKVAAQKCLRNLNRYWKEIMLADVKVQKAVNALLDYKEQGEAIRYLLLKFNISLDAFNGDNLFDYDPVEIMGLPARDSKSKVLRFYNKASSLYQLSVYDLVDSLLSLHQKIMLFMFHQADLVWVMETDSKKKKMTSNEFLAKLLPSVLSRNECLECIENVLKKNGFDPIPSCAILKELSSWNAYISSNGRKGKEPLLFYDFYRHCPKMKFEEWITLRYLPVFEKTHHRTVIPENQEHGKKALEKAAMEQTTDTDDFYGTIDRDLEQQQSE